MKKEFRFANEPASRLRQMRHTLFGTGGLRRNFLTLLLCLTLGNQICESRGDQVVADGVIYTSIIRLIAHPDLYQGRKVEVIGYYVSGQELSSLYLTKEDSHLGNSQSAIWLQLNQSVTNKLVDAKLKGGYVEVIGTFHYDPTNGAGHMGSWPGELRDISFLQRRK